LILKTFHDFGLSPDVLKAVEGMGFDQPTPIQEKTIPLALDGQDVLGQAQTGTGKTAAFGIPLVEKVSLDSDGIQGLVITPTRELAMQVAAALHRLGKVKRVRTLAVYGGQEIDKQIRSLKKRPHIVVGTPGRLQDHLRRRTIRLNDLRMVAIDEADEMLQMGFIEEIEAILAQAPDIRQTLLFSATMPPAIKTLAEKFMTQPVHVKVKAKEETIPSIEQYYIELHPKQKFDALCRLIETQAPELAMIFARTKKRVDEVAEGLNKRGYHAEGLHGDLSQARRTAVMQRFKQGMISILVATDVAARGLDISGVTHVYNFDIPQEAENYVHRIGRTGRAGKSGVATTFVTRREMDHLRMIEQVIRRKMTRAEIPTIKDALREQQRIAVEQLAKVVDGQTDSDYATWANHLLDKHDPVTVVAAALKLLTKEPNTTPVQISEDGGGFFPNKKGIRGKGGSRGGDWSKGKPHRQNRSASKGKTFVATKKKGKNHRVDV
jgi:ATP-dependent RNA helicase DeaD